MIYLLQDFTDNTYVLMERIDDKEIYSNGGIWTPEVPVIFKEFNVESATTTKSGKYINWWLSKYENYTDAHCVYYCKTFDQYQRWLARNPELLI